ncbi:hypothetical protein Htur_3135 [Haloterrigena turkmenica DSM 5511]|uniref:Uncharacterized protein n=1 Tax=Haloterrigena turkmenica (strain ATCC 51198 / DSM 5511 / JCM 9101 / NCIMB 13204 / VKM B-1734 / 4k) TaxID=543526 RepID=D2RZ32_HALTV|nr:hypothetical protein Htur_3135 [Haloterrigena turkmenica DSM 5511]
MSSEWPREIGDHTVSDEWVCEDCGASYACLDQFRDSPCEA